MAEDPGRLDANWSFSFAVKGMFRPMFAVSSLLPPYGYDPWMGAVALAVIPLGLASTFFGLLLVLGLARRRPPAA